MKLKISKMNNSKIRDIISILLLQLVLTLPFYTADVYGLAISNVKVSKVTSNSATIDWNTDSPSNGKVKYGKTIALGFSQRHDDLLTNHSVTVVNGVDSDSSYLFGVESADVAGVTAVDNNSNNFYTFHTTDITPPPQVNGMIALPASNFIFLTWNNVSAPDLNHFSVYKNGILIANTTKNNFNDTLLAPGSSFVYRVSAVDNSGNEGQQSDTIFVSTSGIDSTPPAVSSIDVLPLTDTTAKITWLTDENSTTTVLFGVNKTDKTKSLTDLVTNHSIVMDGLQKNVVFTFAVRSCDAAGNCANSSSQTFTAGRDTTIPSINLNIPRFINRKVIDIIGSTKPFSSVTLFVNNMNIPVRSLSNNEIGSSGKFIFNQIQLLQDNVIKIVVIDRFGIKNQKIFEASIDTETPVVQSNDIPSLVSHVELPINGTVNEHVTIKVFVDAHINDVNAAATPSKIELLNATKIGQNSIELHWNESTDKDFSHYVVYRDNIPIAVTKPANFNLFIDALVDSGKRYTYQVSQVNIFANEGPKSDPITVQTLKGGAILNLKPPQIDILEDFRKPVLVTEAGSPFGFVIKLDKGDGTYNLKIVFTDRADNNLILEKTVTLDSKKMEVQITSPPSGAFIFENVANEIDVIGKTKPNSRVHLFVGRTPFSFFNQSVEITSTPIVIGDEVQSLPEAQLDAKCRSKLVSTTFCRTGADFSVDSDSQGNFKFEKVDLTVNFGGAARITEISPTNFNNLPLNPESQDSKKTSLFVVATGPTGQRGVATRSVSIGTCWSGNQSWDVIPLAQYQRPTFLSAERFAEGTETLYFFFNYSYIGRGTDAKITGITLTKACGTKEVLDPRFNISCQVMPSGNVPVALNKEKTLSYSAVPVSRFPGMDQFLADDWKGFFKAINNEMTFPFKVRVTYEHNVINENGQSQRITETQTACDQVSYVVDKSIIDPRKVLPDWLLYDAVDFLQSSTKTITQVQQQIDTVINYVAVGCLVSFGANFVIKIYRSYIELTDEILFRVGGKTFLQFNLGNDKDNTECNDLAKAVQVAYGGLKLKYFSDADLKRCFPASASAWSAEAKVYTLQRATCDRLFGHSAPSAWTETEDDGNLHRAVTSQKTCSSDLDVQGQKLRSEDCRGLPEKFINILKDKQAIPVGQKCFVVADQTTKNQQHIYRLSDDQDAVQNAAKMYKLESYESGYRGEIYAYKISDDYYLTNYPQTCSEICNKGLNSQNKDITKSTIEFNEGTYELTQQGTYKPIEGKIVPNLQQKDKKDTLAGCVTVNQCQQWYASSDKNTGGGILLPNGKTIKGYTIERKGYTNGCFFDGNTNNIGVVSDTNPNTRKECCCVNGKENDFKDIYYKPDELDTKLPSQFQKIVHESKTLEGQPPKENPISGNEKGATEKYSDMKWSYRYSKIGYLGKKYNPNRYITGRDFTACFGQDNWFYTLVGKQKDILVVDPFKQDTATLQCVYLTGINQRLQMIKNIMQAMSTCLIQVRTTGRADAGACKEVFTQHLCDLIWQGIKWFIDGCTPSYLGINADDREAGVSDFLTNGVKGLGQGVAQAQQEILSEYSNTKLNDFLGTGEGGVARKVCLFAFGYDWDFGVKNLVDAAYTAPFATLVQAITRSREFLTVDPVTLKPKYEYRASWIINPGCDLENYKIQLACVTRKELDQYPNQISCGSVGAPSFFNTGGVGKSTGFNQCDCLESNAGEQTLEFFSQPRLKQNSLVNKDFHKPIDSSVRYDHLKFILRPDRKIQTNVKSSCFPTGFEQGVFYFPLIDKSARDIADCTVQPESGVFTCSGGVEFFNRKGIAELLGVTFIINGNGEKAEEGKVKTLNIGDSLGIEATVRKTGDDKCLKVSLLTGGSPDARPVFQFISENAVQNIPATVSSSLSTTASNPQILNPNGIVAIVVGDVNLQREEPIAIGFYTKGNSIDFNQNSVDLVRINGKVSQVTNYIQDGQFIYNDPNNNYKIQITSVDLLRNQQGTQVTEEKLEGEFKGKYAFREGTILIRPSGATPAADISQKKTLVVELLHTKDSGLADGVDRCNQDDSITKKSYNILLQPKGALAGEQGPTIGKPITIEYLNNRGDKTMRKGESVKITTKITDTSQVSGAKLIVTDPSGFEFIVDSQQPTLNSYVFIFQTADVKIAGTYKAKINATNIKGKSSIASTPDIVIQCGEGNDFGKCSRVACQSGNPILNGLECPEMSTGDPLADSATKQFCCRT